MKIKEKDFIKMEVDVLEYHIWKGNKIKIKNYHYRKGKLIKNPKYEFHKMVVANIPSDFLIFKREYKQEMKNGK